MVDLQPENLIFEHAPWTDKTIVDRPSYRRRRCSVIVEVWDKRVSVLDLFKMMDAGMNVVQILTSRNSKSDRALLLGKVDKAATTCASRHNVADWPVGTIGTLKTSVVRTGLLENDMEECTLQEGSEVILTNNIAFCRKCNDKKIFVDNCKLTLEVKPGMEISFNEGAIFMKCTEIIDQNSIKAVVTQKGELLDMVTVCARGAIHQRPLITKKDMEILRYICEQQMDAVVIYYVRHRDAVKKVRQFISTMPLANRPLILSAVCTESGLRHIDDILEESDGLIVAREYLHYELPAKLEFCIHKIQKWITGKCQKAGKPIYISGDILKQCNIHGVVTSCQVMNVANALLDGVSGFFLREGSHVEHMLLALNLMNDIACDIEPQLNAKQNYRRLADHMRVPVNAAEAAVMSCAHVAYQTKARVVIVPTVTGATAIALCRYLPSCIIVAVTMSTKVVRKLAIFRSVVPLKYVSKTKDYGNTQDRIDFALDYAVKRFWISFGDLFVTLQRGTEWSSCCDMVRVWPCSVAVTPVVICEGDSADTYCGHSCISGFSAYGC